MRDAILARPDIVARHGPRVLRLTRGHHRRHGRGAGNPLD
jgi:hypothetical protein